MSLSDQAHDDVKDHGSSPVTRQNANEWFVFRGLPGITWNMEAQWRHQVARSCEDPRDPNRGFRR